MDWLNYHHLLYFWVVAREGSLAKASQHLHVSQPTISSQLRKLERSLNLRLFDKAGRRLVLSEQGKLVFTYAEEIFTTGRELQGVARGQSSRQPQTLSVGLPDVLPKLIVYRLLQPAFSLPEPFKLVCREGTYDQLLTELSTHALDIVFSDRPVGPDVRVRVFRHLLGQSGVTLFGPPAMVKKLRRGFPNSLRDAPWLLPTTNTTLRRQLDDYFDQQGFQPRVVGEFQDSALLKAFGSQGLGIFAGLTVSTGEIRRQYGVEPIGELEGVLERFYAISLERRLKHPAVLAIITAARSALEQDASSER